MSVSFDSAKLSIHGKRNNNKYSVYLVGIVIINGDKEIRRGA
jgi:hypothetical protein